MLWFSNGTRVWALCYSISSKKLSKHSIPGNQSQQIQQHHYPNINPNIHTGLISSTGRNPTFAASIHQGSQMDTTNGKDDAEQDSNKNITYIDQPMLNAMEQMFSQPQQQTPVQQFHPQIKQQFHPTTAPTSTPQLYFN